MGVDVRPYAAGDIALLKPRERHKSTWSAAAEREAVIDPVWSRTVHADTHVLAVVGVLPDCGEVWAFVGDDIAPRHYLPLVRIVRALLAEWGLDTIARVAVDDPAAGRFARACGFSGAT